MGIIIFPTDTVYGIGCKIFDCESIKKIYEIKHRPLTKPLACLCYDVNDIKKISYVSPIAEKLIDKFLPGPLTIILKTKEEVYEKIGYKTIGVRIPNNKIALEILKENGPMLTTSVNESGNVPLNEYNEIYNNYHTLVDKVYNTNTTSSNVSSTVIMLDVDTIKFLRIGEISKEEILKFVEKDN